MENAKKNLKFISAVMLICLTFSFIREVLEIFLTNVKLDNISFEYIIIAKIVICLIYAVMFLPQIYVGVKGIKVSKKPDSSKAHIIWAVIFIVFAAFAAISATINIAKSVDVTENVFELIDAAIDFAFYFLYVKYAKQILQAA